MSDMTPTRLHLLKELKQSNDFHPIILGKYSLFRRKFFPLFPIRCKNSPNNYGCGRNNASKNHFWQWIHYEKSRNVILLQLTFHDVWLSSVHEQRDKTDREQTADITSLFSNLFTFSLSQRNSNIDSIHLSVALKTKLRYQRHRAHNHTKSSIKATPFHRIILQKFEIYSK